MRAVEWKSNVKVLRQPRHLELMSIVVPVMNEQEAVPIFLKEIAELRLRLRTQHAMESEVVFVDDGSSDDTREVIRREIAQRGEANWIRMVVLSRNFGKEVALTAGMRAAAGDVVVPMDVDLQDPPETVLDMVKVWRESGASVVQAIRSDRSEDSFAKRFTADRFYKLMSKISSVKLEPNAGDFQLLTRPAVEALMEYPEKTRFMKGLSASIGFKRAKVYYKRSSRVAGVSKFNGWKLWNFALDGITAFSTLPLRVWTYVGVMMGLSAVAFGCWTIVRTMVFGVVTPGYASLMVTMLFMGGLQLIGIGVVGEYVGRVAQEVRNRPMYHVETMEGFKETSE